MVSDYPEHMLKEFESLVTKGCLASYRLTTWHGYITHSFKKDNIGFAGGPVTTYSPAIKKTQYQIELQILRFNFKKLFRFCAYKIPIGVFIPERNIEYFKKEAIALKESLIKFRDATLIQYPVIMADVRKRHEELAEWVWEHEYKNIGKPPESFVHKFCDDCIKRNHSLAIVKNRFKFFISYMPAPVDREDIKELAHSVYDSVIRSRRAFVFYISKKRRQFLATKTRGPRLKMAKFFNHYKKSLFYGDTELNRLLEEMIRKAILYPNIKSGEFAEDLRKIIIYLIESQDYPIGMQYDDKQ